MVGKLEVWALGTYCVVVCSFGAVLDEAEPTCPRKMAIDIEDNFVSETFTT